MDIATDLSHPPPQQVCTC